MIPSRAERIIPPCRAGSPAPVHGILSASCRHHPPAHHGTVMPRPLKPCCRIGHCAEPRSIRIRRGRPGWSTAEHPAPRRLSRRHASSTESRQHAHANSPAARCTPTLFPPLPQAAGGSCPATENPFAPAARGRARGVRKRLTRSLDDNRRRMVGPNRSRPYRSADLRPRFIALATRTLRLVTVLAQTAAGSARASVPRVSPSVQATAVRDRISLHFHSNARVGKSSGSVHRSC